MSQGVIIPANGIVDLRRIAVAPAFPTISWEVFSESRLFLSALHAAFFGASFRASGVNLGTDDDSGEYWRNSLKIFG